jgi:hypothetical protein
MEVAAALIKIGVLVGTATLGKLQSGEESPRLEALLRANEQEGSRLGTEIFFFTLEDVNFSGHRIRGIYRSQGQWEQKSFAYPHALYRRLTLVEKDQAVHAKLLEHLRAQGTVFLNYPWPMDKWELYQCLERQPQLRKFLPPTQIIADDRELLAFLEENPVTYLKACKGGRGKQVMRVKKVGKDSFAFSRFNNYLVQGRMHRARVIQSVREFFGNRPFIAQQGIDLLQVNGRNLDFRAEVQRAERGQLRVVAIPVRIARDRSPITTHAKSMALEEFARRHPEAIPDYQHFYPRAEEFLRTFYEGVEVCFGPCGELGIDFALDKAGQWWFIEANTQSAKVSLLNSYPPAVTDQSFIGLLEYARFRVEANS